MQPEKFKDEYNLVDEKIRDGGCMNHNKKLLFAISIGWMSVGCGPGGPASAPEELFMGHSFFKPFANNMVALQEANGLEAKSMA